MHRVHSLFKISLYSLTALAFAACHSAPKKAAAVSDEAKVVAQQNEASYVTEIGFKKGSSDLSANAKSSLDSVIQKARAAGKVDEIKVVTWADAEYPSEAAKRLPKAQRDLASRRNSAITKFIKDRTDGIDVDEYNMAERPNSLERLLSTSDARIKRSLETAGIATTAHDLRFPENASKSMVMVILE